MQRGGPIDVRSVKKLGIVILIILAFLGAEENYLLLLKRIIFLGVAIIFIVGPLLLLTLLVCEILPPKRIRLVNESVSVLRIRSGGRSTTRTTTPPPYTGDLVIFCASRGGA